LTQNIESSGYYLRQRQLSVTVSTESLTFLRLTV